MRTKGMAVITAVITAVLVAVSASGQVSEGDAAAKLRERQLARSTTTQASEDAQRVIRLLQQQIADLRVRLDRLQKENDGLRKDLVSAQAELAPFKQAAGGNGGAGARPAAVVKAIAANDYVVGMTKAEADQVRVKANDTFSELPSNQDLLIGGKAVHQETWRLNRIRRNTIHFTNDIVDEVSD